MKHIKIIFGLILLATVSTFAQSPRIKLNQITKDTVKGSVLISSPSDSGMVYSRDFYIAYGADTVLILYGDTLAATSGIISSVLSDGVTITGDGTSGNELKVDTSTVISTIQGLVDSLANYVTTNTAQTITGAKTFTSDLNIDAKIALDDGDGNIVIGDNAGISLVGGQATNNLLIGVGAGSSIDSAINNIAIGYSALNKNISGNTNSAIGYQALNNITDGTANNAIGYQSLSNLIVGTSNAGYGQRAFGNLKYGSNNIGLGSNAGRFEADGTVLDSSDLSIYIGSGARASANNIENEIVIGNLAIGNGNNSVTIGNDGTIGTATSKVVLNGVGSTGGTNSALYITSGGELTTNSSDQRLKTNINPLDSELNTLINLNPVRYNYYDDLENDAIGFIAQELEIYYPNLVFTNPVSGYKGVHYHLFAPLIVKAIQEQQAIIETQEQKITDLQTTIQSLITRIENLENK